MPDKNLNSKKLGLDQDKKLPAEHKGMAPLDPQPQDNLVGKQITQRDVSSEASLHLPHERDQSSDMTATGRSPIIEQAFEDEMNGLQDTSKHPEMDAAYDRQKGQTKT